MLPRRSRSGVNLAEKRKPTGEKSSPPSSYAFLKGPTNEERDYPHTCVFRSSHMEIHIRSPSVKVMRQPGIETARSLPLFGDHNKVSGTVLLDVGVCSTPGRLTVSMEGDFTYISPPTVAAAQEDFLQGRNDRSRSRTWSSSNVSLRDAIAATVRARGVIRQSSQPDLKDALRPFPFTFEIPPPAKPGEELPSTFCSVVDGLSIPRGRAFVERAEITYKVAAIWETSNEYDRMVLEAPLLFQPDTDFESLDVISLEPDSWLEIPLRCHRPLPFECAVALPDSGAFPRSASIPYYVVFTTNPRSPPLARELIADATITVALVRQVNIDAPVISSTSTSPTAPSVASSSSSGDDRSWILTHKTKLMKRKVSSAPPVLGRKQRHEKQMPFADISEKPLPPVGLSETRTLYTIVSVGFPKRPRSRVASHERHPSLIAHTSLPDGLYKGKIQLDKNMIPTIEWADLSVKYFLEVAVLFGQDESRTRLPIRIF